MRNLFTVKTHRGQRRLVARKSNHSAVRDLEILAPSQSVIGKKRLACAVLKKYVHGSRYEAERRVTAASQSAIGEKDLAMELQGTTRSDSDSRCQKAKRLFLPAKVQPVK